MTYFAFGIGCFVGCMVTILSLALASAASDRDDRWEEE